MLITIFWDFHNPHSFFAKIKARLGGKIAFILTVLLLVVMLHQFWEIYRDVKAFFGGNEPKIEQVYEGEINYPISPEHYNHQKTTDVKTIAFSQLSEWNYHFENGRLSEYPSDYEQYAIDIINGIDEIEMEKRLDYLFEVAKSYHYGGKYHQSLKIFDDYLTKMVDVNKVSRFSDFYVINKLWYAYTIVDGNDSKRSDDYGDMLSYIMDYAPKSKLPNDAKIKMLDLANMSVIEQIGILDEHLAEVLDNEQLIVELSNECKDKCSGDFSYYLARYDYIENLHKLTILYEKLLKEFNELPDSNKSSFGLDNINLVSKIKDNDLLSNHRVSCDGDSVLLADIPANPEEIHKNTSIVECYTNWVDENIYQTLHWYR